MHQRQDGLQKIERSRKLFTKPPSHRLTEAAAVEPVHDADAPSGFEYRLDYYKAPKSESLLRDAWAFVMDAIDQHLEETGVKMTMRWDATRRSARFYIAPGRVGIRYGDNNLQGFEVVKRCLHWLR